MKELLRLLPYMKKYRAMIILGLVFVTISNVCSTLAPRFVGRTIDMIKTGGFSEQTVALNIGIILLLTLGSGAFMFLTRRRIMVASRLIEYELRNDFLDALQRQKVSFFHKNSTGSLMAHATNDIAASREFMGPAVMFSANSITMFLLAMFFMLSLDPMITLLALIPLPLIAAMTYFLGRKVHVAFRDVQEQFADLTAQAQESFSGIKVVKAYLREAFEQKHFSGMSREYLDKNLKLAKVQTLMVPAITILIGTSLLVVLSYGGLKVIEGEATLGDLTQFFIYLNLLIWPVAAIGWITNLLQRASASAGRLGKIFDSVEHLERDKKEDESLNIKGEIEFDNVHLRYDEGQQEALSGVKFKIPAGSSLGIVGSVGSGKSTIGNLIAGLYSPTKGRISIDGNNIDEIPLKNLRDSVGMVPQEPFLFSNSIEENIKFGKQDATEEEIIEAAKAAQFHDEVMSFPDGYKTELGERGITLSGGQMQRLALARAIIRNPKILILDDAFSSVDSGTEEKIRNNLQDIIQKRTTIIISHRISTVMDAALIIVLDAGRIIESGAHDELMRRNGRYAEMHEHQQMEEEIEEM